MTHTYRTRDIEETISGETLDALDASGDDLTDSHVETDVGDWTETDLSGALDALRSQCWDSLDWRESQVIAYPADDDHDYRTGDRTRTTVVVEGSPDAMRALQRAYDGDDDGDDWDEETALARFDLYGALWLFCSQYHSGQSSRGYRILSRLTRAGYSPGIGLQRGDFESETQEETYRDLVSRYGETI